VEHRERGEEAQMTIKPRVGVFPKKAEDSRQPDRVLNCGGDNPPPVIDRNEYKKKGLIEK
jgi:hypothetical protein